MYFGSYVRIGESEYGILDPFGQIYYPVYKGIYELNFPFPPNDWIVTNAELSVRKMEFSTLDTQLGYITSEIPYENINGVTSYTVEDYVDDQFSSQYLTYDITDIINDRLQSNEDHLIFDITRKYNISQYARFYSAESNYSPIVEFTLNGAGYGETQYGTATIYTAVKPYLLNDINCFGYAVNVNDWLGLFDTPQEYSAVTVSNETLYTYYLPAVLSTLDENNLNGRILNDIDSAIFNVERRIAFRIGSVNDEIWRDSHFMKQHSNGNWSQKLGPLSSYQYPSGQTPNTINWNDWLSIYGQQYNTYYDSYVVYIAIYNDV
ncbi:MAG TPA: hypothetical protein DEG42_00135 [Acholeplasmataceae bacterium]|nr:hypothetical protein [Acholeplasmataceae bacterium]